MAMPKSIGASPHSFPSSSRVPLLHMLSIRNEEKAQASATGPTASGQKSSPSSNATPIALSVPPYLSVQTTKASASASAKTSPTMRGAETPGSPPLSMMIFNALEDFINKYIDPPTQASMDPSHVLSDNFAPVDELSPMECEVIEGSLPPFLDGAYIRNGPNPQLAHRRPYHFFDGDGMLHSIRISQGKATLCSRYIKTYKYNMERQAGTPLVPSVFCGFNNLAVSIVRVALSLARILAGHFNPANGIGVANTSLALFGNRLYALGESDLPYAVRLTSNGDVETLGRHDFDGKLTMSMTAHPKIDVETGEVFAFSYCTMHPFLTYFRFDSNGNKQPDVPVFSMARPSFLHDFAITNKYAIFVDMQIGLKPLKMMLGRGSAVCTDLAKVPRIGIIPRYAKDESEMKWFDMPGFNPVHTINAWDEGEAIVMLAPNILQVQYSLERTELTHSLVEKVTIDLKTGIITRIPISTRNLDFAVIDPAYMGKKNRFVYAAIGEPMPKISGVVKIDVSKSEREECIVARRMFGPRCYGGEPFFVAREPDNPEREEDDGYLMCYVHDEIAGESKFLVMDSKSTNLDIVAVVKLPRRVPYGFHGLFVRERDLKKL